MMQQPLTLANGQLTLATPWQPEPLPPPMRASHSSPSVQALVEKPAPNIGGGSVEPTSPASASGGVTGCIVPRSRQVFASWALSNNATQSVGSFVLAKE